MALETVGNSYWIVDEIEEAGCLPLLAHAAKAKVMMGNTNKTDKLDAKGLVTLLRNRTLPGVWIPPREVRDERELPRTRMFLAHKRASIKNRIHATLSKYGISFEEASDLFSGKGRELLASHLLDLPPETRRGVEQELCVLDALQAQIEALEGRIRERGKETETIRNLKTLPGVGDILAVVIEREAGDISRFPDSERFAGYCGAVPKVSASGGKVRQGHLRKDVNQYLKWAFIEAGSVVARHRNSEGWQGLHVVRLYHRVRGRKGHGKAVGVRSAAFERGGLLMDVQACLLFLPTLRRRRDDFALRGRGRRGIFLCSAKLFLRRRKVGRRGKDT